jgi:methionine aminotransferase
MPEFTGTLGSKLPRVGTTIFTVMSKLAGEHQAINLSQGFPDFECPKHLRELVNDAMKKGITNTRQCPVFCPCGSK